ncbi:hypothetical protein DFH07DRAFT_858493 [Mycena maculata]|uniref:BTB domain-containing protein n=1 Tax=Mycena maculata TaxID=230809 RepID=A0AAD7HHA9_9AGAR|nr:hypothetical protein DFH07DRAFT_858493 [Mycena maculata]
MERLTHPGAGLPVAVASGSTSQPPSLKSPVETTQGNFRYVRGPSAGSVQILDPETELELERHADLWFKDGSVICQAERTLFRVHISQLSRHSALFRTIFTLPQPSRPRSLSSFDSLEDTQVILDECENCPVVFLHDTAEDVANFLAALYDGPNFGDNGRADFGVVSGVLRLSTKYIVDALAQKALAHLSIAWPSTLKGWDAREDLARSFELETSTSGGHFYPSPIAVINLAREVNAPSLLPAAFYDLCRYSYAQIYEPAEDEPLYQPTPAPSLSTLDMQRLALGKEAAQHNITSLIQTMGHAQTHIRAQTHAHIRKNSSGGICVSAAACRKDFSELVDLATQHYLFDRERGHCDPLYVSEELGQLKSAEFSECKACARSLELWAARERERMFKMIPIWFRLDFLAPAEQEPGSPRAL